jgi:ribonuclease III
LVNLICAEHLYQSHVDADEGELTRTRSALVDQSSLAGYARELDLGAHLILGGGELKSGGYRRDSILSDAFEALVAAIYLDFGHATAAKFVIPFFRTRLNEAVHVGRDPKTQLQEWLQDKGRPLPRYELLSATGQEHARSFTVCCVIDQLALQADGVGSSLKRAEQQAALAALGILGVRK